jgi:Raf kinase inhibitor-like YbhB/YbcL family protein
MTITSDAIKVDGQIMQEYTCDGENTSPPLTFSDIPAGTTSLAFILEDPDAPNGVFTHWLLYDMSPAVLEVVENQMPVTGKAGTNDFGNVGYASPCPPSGTHRYVFRLFALDAMLDLPEGASRQDVQHAMRDHVIDSAEVTSTYTKA